MSITQWPASPSNPSQYAYDFSWAAADEDGAVTGYRWAVDPPRGPNAETLWVWTRENRRFLQFPVDSPTVAADGVARQSHTFVVEAQDDRGAWSAPAAVSFDATTILPSVAIVTPRPSGIGAGIVAPTVQVRWTGRDPDAVVGTLPVRYRYQVFSQSTTPTVSTILANVDTLRALFAPRYAGWDSLPGTATSIVLSGLTPGQRFVFAIIAVDTAGAASPGFSLYENALELYVDPGATLGPQLTLYNDAFWYRYPSGGWFSDPASYIRQEFPADVPLSLSWSSLDPTGGIVQSYRWAVDLRSLEDETPRSNETTDLSHWSQPSLGTHVTLPAFGAAASGVGGPHWFYLQAEDAMGYRSLAVIEFRCVRATFSRDLLIVNDTGFSLDKAVSGGCVDRPRGAWPTAAELDTFLCAVGDKPWRCYPAGTRSTPGLFAGYDFDTVSTRTLPLGGLTLSRLGRYRNVIWMTDNNRARAHASPVGSGAFAMPMLRALTEPGTSNPLAMWNAQGGRLWLMGGGIAYGSLISYKPPRGTPDNVFTSSTGELVPGRFMYAFPHWRNEITLNYTVRAARSERAVGGWPGAPDYSSLPALLAEKTLATDPLPPYRTSGDFLSSGHVAEYLSQPTAIIEGLDTSASPLRSALDTLYLTQGGVAGTGWPVMTLYHGEDCSPVVCSGFPLWYFQRAHAIALVDWVLQAYWGMTRRPVAR